LTTNFNKKILIAPELLSSEAGLFFQELGYEFSHTATPGEQYVFAVDNICPEILDVPRFQVSQTINQKLIPSVRGYADLEFFKNEHGKKVLTSHFNEANDVDLIERYSENLKTVYNIKLQDYLNTGFFVDSVIVDAYKAKFDVIALRNYMNTLLKFAFNKVEINEHQLPFAISYSHDENAFVVQLTLSVDKFAGKSEFDSIFDELMANSNYFDVTYFPKKSKLIISSLLFNQPSMKKFKAYFFTEVSRRTTRKNDEYVNLYSGLMIKDGVDYDVRPDVESEHVSQQITLARKFALFIKNTRKKQNITESILRHNIDDYVAIYPRMEMAQEINEEIKDLAFKFLKDDESYVGMSEYVQRITATNLNEEIPDIQEVLKTKTLADIEEIAAIKGASQVKESPYTVKGWIEKEEEVQKIEGNFDLSNDEIWEIKKHKLSEKIGNEVERLQSEGKNIILDDLVRIVGNDLGTNHDDIRPVLEWIVEEVVARGIKKNKKLEEVFTLGLFESVAPEAVITQPVVSYTLTERLQDQNARMKKIMEQMKREIIKLQKEKAYAESVVPVVQAPSVNAEDLARLKMALSRAMSTLKTKDRLTEKLRRDVEGNFKIKESKIISLEQRIEEMKVEFAKSKEFADIEKMERLEAENKILLARIDLANKKVSNTSDNLNHVSEEIAERHENEIESLKMSVQMAQVLIERLKQDKHDMDLRFHDEKEFLIKEYEEKISEAGTPSGKPDSIAKKDNPLLALTNEKKALEERFRAQSIELKKVEHKLKFATSQLESSSAKKEDKAKAKSNEAYVKQIDLMNIRMENATAEVAEKRKELHKVKQENALLSTKVIELERKMASLEKKAA
jgi:hypothetical protein